MDFEKESWWEYLDESQRELLKESFLLLEREEKSGDSWHDYAFVVFPAAKAYEGFLKKLFLDLGLLTQNQYQGDRFRIGRALNPNLEKELRSESAYDKLEALGYPRLPEDLWQTWKRSRNLLFHWFPWHRNAITLAEARARLEMIVNSIRGAVAACNKVDNKVDREPQ